MQAHKVLFLALLAGCSGRVSDNQLSIQKLPMELVASELTLSEQSGFADELGGIFADEQGKAVRIRVDGTRAPLESHPGNAEPAGAVRALFTAGPFTALVAADNGLYIAQAGWLIQPAWREAMAAEGVRAAALAADGVAWIAHENGLFRVENGELAELKIGDDSITKCTALAAAPAPDGSNAIWFVQDDTVRYAKQTARARYQVNAGGLDATSEVLGLAALPASTSSPGELWLLTKDSLFRHTLDGWREYAPPATPETLQASGRFLWLRAGGELYRYDGNRSAWAKLTLPAPRKDLRVLAADASGSAWLRSDVGETMLVREGPVARIAGLFESAHVYTSDVLVRARFLASEAPDSVQFSLDGQSAGEQGLEDAVSETSGTENLAFALGGFDASGREKSYSLAGLASGVHVLTIEARFSDRSVSRSLSFDLRPSASAALSYAKDIEPIFEARCKKCHDAGPARTLNTYELWVGEKEKIVSAVTELRMPADGPLDPAQIQLLQRWAAGESAP